MRFTIAGKQFHPSSFAGLQSTLEWRGGKKMARIQGVEPSDAGLLTRFLYWMTKRRLGRVILPFRITAHQPRLLRAMGEMEMGQRALETVEPKLKELASIKTALLIGCPF
jgi:hypothetical protein